MLVSVLVSSLPLSSCEHIFHTHLYACSNLHRYMSEIAPRKVRGAVVAGYQFCITIGILLANCVVYATQGRDDTGSYRIPIAVQFLWAIILAGGLALLPDSPRFFVKKGKLDKAAASLARVRGQPIDSEYIQDELAEIIANHEYEMSIMPQTSYLGSWAACFKGKISSPSSNARRTTLGIVMQMMQQLTGINFIFYFGTVFFKQLGTISNPFLISLVTTLVNVLSTPFSFIMVEKIGRRNLLVFGAALMVIFQFITAIIGATAGKPGLDNQNATRAMIAFICLNISAFATTWGPCAWIVIGEIFPLTIRSRGVGLATASNWFWNCIIAVITPYLVADQKHSAKLGSHIFFMWGGLCCVSFLFAFFFVPETKGLTLEQVDKMLEESTPRTSSKWKPHSTFAADMHLAEKHIEVPIATEVHEPKNETV